MSINFIVLWEIFSFPFTRMVEIDPKDFLDEVYHERLLIKDEKIMKCYDNRFKSFLITNMRLIGIQKFRVIKNNDIISKILSIPLPQIGTTEMFKFNLLRISVLRITTAPGFKFYWFFKRTERMEEITKTIVELTDLSQGSGNPK